MMPCWTIDPPTSCPRSLFFRPTLAPCCGKKRDPGNQGCLPSYLLNRVRLGFVAATCLGDPPMSKKTFLGCISAFQLTPSCR